MRKGTENQRSGPAKAPNSESRARAQDGGQLYQAYCGACHGEQGQGAGEGAFPPLAHSRWVDGDPRRAVEIVLNGLNGALQVRGKTYNLAMPPQGAVLDDRKVAAILTYVRSAWGNAAPPVSPELVAAVRSSKRDQPWSADDLLKKHPLPLQKTNLSGLTSRTYAGSWMEFPDFSELKPENGEEEQDGVLRVSQSSLPTNHALVWEAKFEAPEDGEYMIRLDADDRARVFLGGRVIEQMGTGAMDGSREVMEKVLLDKGAHPFRVELLQLAGDKGLRLGWLGPSGGGWRWLSELSSRPALPWPNLFLQAQGPGEPVIYRNFIEGTTPRAIAFGFHEEVHFAYSADHLGPELMWRGLFINAGRHWTDRGAGFQKPAGSGLIRLTSRPALPEGSRFLGFRLDAAGHPVFRSAIGAALLEDSLRPGGGDAIVRRLSLSSPSSPLSIALGDHEDAKLGDERTMTFGSLMTVEIDGGELKERDGAVWLTVEPGKQVLIHYRWN